MPTSEKKLCQQSSTQLSRIYAEIAVAGVTLSYCASKFPIMRIGGNYVNRGNGVVLSIGRRLSSWLCTKRLSAELHIEVSLLKTTISRHNPNFGAKPLLLNLDVLVLYRHCPRSMLDLGGGDQPRPCGRRGRL